MSFRRPIDLLLAAGMTYLLVSPLPAAAETICTHIIQSREFGIPMDERESARQVQSRMGPGFVAEGDRWAREGKLAAAVQAYEKVFSAYEYGGVHFGAARCLSRDFYQATAAKLRDVASVLAEERTAKGHLLDESHEYGGDVHAGALRLYLVTNQYDRFIAHAFAYAKSELPQRDIDRALIGLVDQRLNTLRREQDSGSAMQSTQYVNDLTPLLEEELAAFTKLAGFEEELRAQLAPLYPKVADQLLAEEAGHFSEFKRTDGVIPKAMLHDRATRTLRAGIDRLAQHPQQLARLRARANARGEALYRDMAYAYAGDYFGIAGNDERQATAERLGEQQQNALITTLEATAREDLEAMMKSDEEKQAFQDEADDLAAEFGFELDD